jgi:hypothetical protein
MKKTFSLEIKTPCDANLDAMNKTNNGFYCNLCTKNVIDLSNKSNYEIGKIISEAKDKNICARLKTTQLDEEFSLVENQKSANFKYAIAVAASVLLTTNITAQENQNPKTEINSATVSPHKQGKIAYVESKNTNVSFQFTGKLLDKVTGKPLSKKQFAEINLRVEGSEKTVKVDPKTGYFTIPLTLDKNQKEIYINIYSDNLHYSKTMIFDSKLIKNKTLNQNIKVDPKEFLELHIAGGLGVIYKADKKNSNS